MLAKTTWNFPKLGRRFEDVIVRDVIFMFPNQPFDLFFEGLSFLERETYLALSFSRP